MNNKALYATHRWISVLALGQLGIWSFSGLLFTTLTERAVMSAPVAGAHDLPIDSPAGILGPESIWQRARSDHAGDAIHRIELRSPRVLRPRSGRDRAVRRTDGGSAAGDAR